MFFEVKSFITKDLVPGVLSYRSWLAIVRRNVKALNRRSKLGALWITLTAMIFILCLAFVYSVIFKTNIKELMPYIAIGYVLWLYISGCLLSMPPLFIQMSNYINQKKLPLTIYIVSNVVEKLELLLRQSVVVLIICITFQTGLSWSLLILPFSFLLLSVMFIGLSFILSPLGVRYRDVGQLLNSITLLIFLVTPIIWKAEYVGDRFALINWNPFYHIINIIRSPILDHSIPWLSLLVCLGITIFFWVLGILFMSYYRHRIIFWL